MNLQTILDNNDAVKEWLAKHRKFDVLDKMASQNRPLVIMPLMTDTKWAMMHRFVQPDGELKLGLILCDRKDMSQLDFIACCMAGAMDNGVIMEPTFTSPRNHN